MALTLHRTFSGIPSLRGTDDRGRPIRVVGVEHPFYRANLELSIDGNVVLTDTPTFLDPIVPHGSDYAIAKLGSLLLTSDELNLAYTVLDYTQTQLDARRLDVINAVARN